MNLRKRFAAQPQTAVASKSRGNVLNHELIVIGSLVVNELRKPEVSSVFSMAPRLAPPKKPITTLTNLHTWTGKLLAKLKVEGREREWENLYDYALTLMKRSSYYLAQVTPAHLILEELTVELADFVVRSEPYGPNESGVYFGTALEIAHAVLYEALPLQEAVRQFDRLLKVIEPGCEPEVMETARALVAELDLRLALEK